ncbi:hypothetical protein SLG_22200 [Sphingobium sp. SYK-6]|uniref:hypothetical protein n=1 Tax=Sphingobium sp. (strain NBRC 103272 / SYK-6) TaxID=627192 RepID=UPI000227713B|nr:hypothetical protein [Sphingobium sp. SYK-6]BAK66895.1 hypothetical protein SLG_22200 [Sphingobium sp. SYK-6]
MSRPDATASAALDHDFIRPGFFCFLDIVGDPFRINTLGVDLLITGTPYPEMNDQTFLGVTGRLVDIGPVNVKGGGSDSVMARLSGLRDLDNDTLNTIGDRANWQGRTAMLWRMIRDVAGAQQGAIQHYYTGYMTSLAISGEPQSQTIELTIESYLAAFSEASNRTYLDQELFDPGDLSARASIAIANGISGNPLMSNTQTNSGGGARPVGYSGQPLK